MPFCFPYRPWSRLAALTVLALVGCSAFESQADNFPDAGPNGPDSTYAGVGQGIPFGEFALTPDQFRPPYTGAVGPVTRSNVASVVRGGSPVRTPLGPGVRRKVASSAWCSPWRAEGATTSIRTAPSISSFGR